MVATATWKKTATETVFKGYPVTFAVVYVGLGADSFAIVSNDEIAGEVESPTYARIPVQWSDFISSMSNETLMVWTVAAGWPSVGAVFMSDSFQGGHALAYETFTAISANPGDTFKIDIGGLILN